MSGDRNFRSRVEVWLYRRLRPLLIERKERRSLKIEGLAPLPEPSREPRGLARYKRLAAGAVLVAAAAAGGTVIGYGWGHEAAERPSPEPAAHAPKVPKYLPGPPPERAPWPPPEQDAPNQDAPASKSERQRPGQN